MELTVRDLIGVSWDAMNCAALTREVHRRLGHTCPWMDVWAGPVDDVSIRVCLEDLTRGTRWAKIPAAEQVGDVILSHSAAGQSTAPLHLSVIVSRGKALTTSIKTGAVIIPARRVARILSCWRWIELPA